MCKINMEKVNVIISSIVSLILLFIFFRFFFPIREMENYSSKEIARVLGTAFSLISAGVLLGTALNKEGGLLGTYLKEGEGLVLKSSNMLHSFNQDKEFLFISWSNRMFMRKVKCLDITFSDIKLQPITDNPKVRNLRYSVSVVGIRTSKMMIKFLIRFRYHSDQSRRDAIRSLLYELNEEKSKLLSKFYNPLRSDQQGEFRKIIEEYLNPKIKEWGLQVSSASFSL